MCLHAGTWDGIFFDFNHPFGATCQAGECEEQTYRQSLLRAAHSGKYNSWLCSTILQSERPDLNHFLNVFEQHVS